MEPTHKNLWETLWDYDPNGLIAVDPLGDIRLVNPAFCRMFQVNADKILGANAATLFGDLTEFEEVWRDNKVLHCEQEFPEHELYVRKVLFAIRAEKIVACIFIDMTREWRQRSDTLKMRHEAIAKVHEVVDNQMKVAQEIAGLLGETTAETKVGLLKLIDMIDTEQSIG